MQNLNLAVTGSIQ